MTEAVQERRPDTTDARDRITIGDRTFGSRLIVGTGKYSDNATMVAALRASDPEWSPRCLFRCETGAGAHVGPSGRFGHLDYEAEVYAWLLDRLAVPVGSP